MWRRDKWHKFTASILALAMLLTMLAVPTASAEEEVRTVAVTDEEGQEVTDVATEKDDTKAIEQQQTDTETNSSEMTDDEGIPTEEDSSQIDETGSEITNTPDSADKEESDTEMTPLPSTENSVSTETSNHSDKKDSKDSDITEQSTTEQSNKQEKFALKGTVTLEELTGKNVPWKYILVRLYDADTYDENAENHTYIAESQTKTDGTYTFEDVEPGNYRVEFISRNKLYEDISCKWKEPSNGEKKIYTVEMTRQRIGIEEENKEVSKGGNEKDQEEPEEYFAFIKKIALPQEDLLRTEQDDSDTYVELNLELVETRQEEESEDREEEKQEEAIESENDFSDMMSIEDLKHIDEDIAAATMEKREPSEIQTMDVNGGTWSFDAYYINEDDRHDVTKTNDFHLKYQMEFHTNNQVIAAGDVEIRIKKTLLERPYNILKKRNYSGPIEPSEIAVPSGNPGTPTESESTPFNYYVENDELVFFNYKNIEAGTNIAFQVLYRNVEVMYIEDGSDWSLKPTITVKGSDPETGKLDGRVDTGVTLTSVTKTPYDDVGKRYTPGLYTEAQVEKYIGKKLPLKFNDYRYVIWEVEVKGTATQPWDIDVRERPGQSGIVLGYCVGDTTATNGTPVPGQPLPDEKDENGYVRLTNENNMKEGQFDRRQRYTVQNVKGSDSYVFYVVVAYPKAEVDKDSLLENNIDVRLSPLDGLKEGEEPEEKTATAKWNYINYTWSYKGDNYELSKKASAAKYEGWMEIYKNAKKNGETVNLPALDFHIKGNATGYGLTHRIKEENGEKYSEVIKGASYSVSVIDDVLYAFSMEDNRNHHILDGTDYYYSAVSISSNDYEYDFYEDEYTTPENGETLEIYAMFAKGDGAQTGRESNIWTKVDEVNWDPNGMTYTFSSEQLAREPWRVKAVHNTTNYETECSINVSVRLRQESEKLATLISDNTQAIKILNLAGMVVEQFVPEEGTDEIIRTIVNATKDEDLKEGLYEEPGLMDLTKALYEDVLIQRNNAETQLCGLEKDACAYKLSTTQTNDPNNSRTQVTYQISAYDGYKVQSEAMVNDLKNLGVTSPGRNKVVFYDLLPYGMHFDPSYQVKVRRIKGPAQAKWEKTDDDQLIVTTDIKDNYEGTGRTLVAFHIEYTGGDSASFYKAEGANSGHWKEHFGVEFRAYYSWKDITVVDAGVNACAFMSEEEPNWPLLGKESQVAKDNGDVVPQNLKDYCKDFGIDIDKDGDYDESVLYATTATVTNAAVATSTEIKKLVRADYDVSGEYQKSAVVAPGEGYTYDITVSTNDNTSIQNLVVFDRLENVDGNEWNGTFKSVIKYGLELLGVQPVIYYHAKSDAPIPDTDPNTGNIKEKPDSAWLTSKEWVRAEQWNPELEVKAVAVDFGNFKLNGGQSVNFRIKMKAPTEGVENNAYTYNNVSYYSVPTNSSDVGTIASGNSTSVKLYGMDELEVVKEFGEGVPVEMEKTSFVFNLTEEIKEGEEPIKFAYKEYQLWKKNESSGKWEYQNDGKNYGTDAEGRLFLHAGEKAVFQLANAEHIHVEEQENPYWKVEKSKDETIKRTDTIDLRTVIFTNTYRPILYVKKAVSSKSVPQGVDISGKTFTFRVYADGKPLANSEFWYFDDIRTDGGIPNRVKALGSDEYKTGTTNEDGEFTISTNDIVGLFPRKVGIEYKVVEILKTGDEAEWICEDTTAEGATVEKKDEENIVEGEIALNGSSVTFTNLYARKELLITKKVTHQDAEDCEQPFTFQIWDATKSAGGEPVYVSGNSWVELDSSGAETSNGGTLQGDGIFTCGADHTVKISGLQAKHTYVIKEINIDELYVPEQDTQEVTMQVYNRGESVTFVNDYRKRSLTVSKRVAYNPGYTIDNRKWYDDNYSFTMTAKITKAGSQEPQPLSVSFTRTKMNGDQEDGHTEADGTFTIKNGESVRLKYVGEIGDTITVRETFDYTFPQLFPVKNGPYDYDGDYEEVIGHADCKIEFINGTKGSMVIINNLVAGNDGGKKLIEIIKDDDSYKNYIAFEDAPDYEFFLEMTGKYNTSQYYTYTSGNISCSYMSKNWNSPRSYYNSKLKIKPGDIGIPYFSNGPSASEYISYTIGMEEECQKFIWCWENAIGGPKWYEFSMIEPENSDRITASPDERPAAIFTNQVKEITLGSQIEKRMALGSNAVPDGAQLVWRLERYNGSSWVPAEGISYTLLDEYGELVTSGIKVTGKDGKLILYKNPNTYPVVQFLDEKVFVNRYDNAKNGDLRLIELLDESDKAWGRLAGYGDEDGNSSLSMSSDDGAVAFVNSNRTTPVKIAKHMESSSDETFTMYLRQVLSATKNPADINSAGDIKESVAGAGIAYIVYDSRTNKELRRGTTGAKGEILIKAGEYARLDLPDKTLWTVSEDIKAKYELEDLTGPPDGRIEDNLMLIYVEAEVVPYKIKAECSREYIFQGESLDTTDFTATLCYSDGTEKTVSDGFTVSPLSPDSGFTGPMQVTVTYEGFTTQVTVIVVKKDKEATISQHNLSQYGLSIENGRLVIPSVVKYSNDNEYYLVTKIANDGFYNNPIEELVLPTSLKEIERTAFSNCKSLIEITIPENVTKIGDRAFVQCDVLKNVTILGSITEIKEYTFDSCKALESIVLPDSITTIEKYAFKGCSALGYIKLPDQLQKIGQRAFSGCTNLNNVTLPDLLQYDDNDISECTYVFADCSSLTDITLPENLKNIPEDMFNGCTSLPDTINIPDSVTTIGNNAFSGCEAFTNFTMPKGVISVKNGVFAGCKNLESVVITSNVKTLGNVVFSNCSNLKNITIENGVTEFGVALFRNCTSLESITIPESVTTIKLYYNDSGKEEDKALPFNGCTSLKEIYIDQYESASQLKPSDWELPDTVKVIWREP